MNTIDFIKTGLETSRTFTLNLIDSMKDTPLAQPTSKGGNHPLWILGHMAYAEANVVNHIIGGNENPLIQWKEMFGMGGDPVTDANFYLPWDQLRQKVDEVRAHTLSVLNTLSEEDLDQPSKNCPPDFEVFFGTVGKCFIMITLHPMMHYGQVADARRMAGLKPLMA